MTVSLTKWTIDDYHQMIAAGILRDRSVELLRGEIVDMSPEGEPHAHLTSSTGEYLIRLLGDRAMVRIDKPITLPNHSEPEPDIAIVQRLGREYLAHHPYPENIFWLIEYSNSSLDKDLNLKSKVYAEVNIPEYWILNLQENCLMVFRHPQTGEYRERFILRDETISPLSFPDLKISVRLLLD
jgi:Uma2 family endonuclease